AQQRRLVDAIRKLDEHRDRAIGWDSVPTGRDSNASGRDRVPTYNDPEVAARIAAYELAFKMQSSVPELMDLSGETQATLDMYGAKPGDGSFASNCLLARRMAERGVRFIQLYHRDWDHHGDLVRYMNICCGLT